MCTLTYLPLGKNKYVITSSRDESEFREVAIFPFHFQNGNKSIFFPKDGKSGGTWIAGTDDGTTGCILNGAFGPHTSVPPYKKSRGLVLLDALKAADLNNFMQTSCFRDIEPFTLVIFDLLQNQFIHDIRWDGNQLHKANLEAGQPAIWSSTMLFDKTNWDFQKNLFLEELINLHDESSLRKFHLHLAELKARGEIKSNAPEWAKVSTLSITSAIVDHNEVSMVYQGIGENQPKTLKLALN